MVVACSERGDQMRALMYFSEVPKLSVLMSAVRLGSSRLPHERADAPFFMPSSRVSPSSSMSRSPGYFRFPGTG